MNAKQRKRFEKEQKKLKKDAKKRKKNKKYQNIINNNINNKIIDQYKKDLDKYENIKLICSKKYDSELNNFIDIDTIGIKVNMMETNNGRNLALTCFLNYLNDLYKKHDKCGEYDINIFNIIT